MIIELVDSRFDVSTRRVNEPSGEIKSDMGELNLALEPMPSVGTTSQPIDFCSGDNNLSNQQNYLSLMMVHTFASVADTSFHVIRNTDGFGSNARFNSPKSVSIASNDLYANRHIRKIILTTGKVSTFAGSLTSTSGTTIGFGTRNMRFNSPQAMCISSNGQFGIIIDNKMIRHIIRTTNLAGLAGHTNGIGTGALFGSPLV
jgi:hypothetical protein